MDPVLNPMNKSLDHIPFYYFYLYPSFIYPMKNTDTFAVSNPVSQPPDPVPNPPRPGGDDTSVCSSASPYLPS